MRFSECGMRIYLVKSSVVTPNILQHVQTRPKVEDVAIWIKYIALLIHTHRPNDRVASTIFRITSTKIDQKKGHHMSKLLCVAPYSRNCLWSPSITIDSFANYWFWRRNTFFRQHPDKPQNNGCTWQRPDGSLRMIMTIHIYIAVNFFNQIHIYDTCIKFK